MKAILFGATGMVGQGVLRECLLDPDVVRVAIVVRAPTGQRHEKLQEIVHADLMNLGPIEEKLKGFDACFFTVGVTSSGMSEEQYTHLTYDMTMSVARTLLRLNPQLTFVFVSGSGTDSTERGRTMWARVKGRAENALLAMPFKGAYMFRPAIIQPMHGIQSKTKSYRVMYAIMWPLLPLMRRLFPGYVTATEQLGRAMLSVAKKGYPKRILESRDINSV